MSSKITLFIICFTTAVVIGLVLYTNEKEVLVKGSSIPSIVYEGNMGKNKLEMDSLRITVIVWFHPDCEHCLYQLDVLNEYLSLFNEARFFFITEVNVFPEERHLGKWKNLTIAENVRFGIVDQNLFRAHFGPVVNPSLFVFDRNSKLKSKLFGEVKIEKLLELINTKIVPEQEKAVLNNASYRG